MKVRIVLCKLTGLEVAFLVIYRHWHFVKKSLSRLDANQRMVVAPPPRWCHVLVPPANNVTKNYTHRAPSYDRLRDISGYADIRPCMLKYIVGLKFRLPLSLEQCCVFPLSSPITARPCALCNFSHPLPWCSETSHAYKWQYSFTKLCPSTLFYTKQLQIILLPCQTLKKRDLQPKFSYVLWSMAKNVHLEISLR